MRRRPTCNRARRTWSTGLLTDLEFVRPGPGTSGPELYLTAMKIPHLLRFENLVLSHQLDRPVIIVHVRLCDSPSAESPMHKRQTHARHDHMYNPEFTGKFLALVSSRLLASFGGCPGPQLPLSVYPSGFAVGQRHRTVH